ncbi:hypothetical protein CNEO2_2280001 [Clostridium neonatale]|nr:hypothetical protein CNEO2_2280001 [Clostridium neonatale]
MPLAWRKLLIDFKQQSLNRLIFYAKFYTYRDLGLVGIGGIKQC